MQRFDSSNKSHSEVVDVVAVVVVVCARQVAIAAGKKNRLWERHFCFGIVKMKWKERKQIMK